MINDYVFLIHSTQSIPFVKGHIAVAQSESKKAYNDVACVDGKWVIGDANAVTGSRLTGNG
jgi:predicted fused transcriptional regulator/phosphomethylpyrimidine kinase